MVVLEILALFLGVVITALVLYWVTVVAPTRLALRAEKKLKAIEVSARHKINKNHQDLFLLVNDLLSLHRLSYQVVFPDQELLQRAEELTTNYRKEVTE